MMGSHFATKAIEVVGFDDFRSLPSAKNFDESNKGHYFGLFAMSFANGMNNI